MKIRSKGQERFRKLAEGLLKGETLPLGAEKVREIRTGTIRTVYNVPQGEGRPPVFVKIIFPKNNILKRMVYPFRRSYGYREFDNAERMRERGLGVVEPLAAAEERGRLMGQGRSILVTKGTRGEEFGSILERAGDISCGGSAEERGRLIDAFADFMRELHQNGVMHRNLKPEHVFVRRTTSGFSFSLIDVDLGKFRKPGKVSRRDLVSEFSRLERNLQSWEHSNVISVEDRGRFWGRYRGIAGELGDAEKKLIGRILRKTEKRLTKGK